MQQRLGFRQIDSGRLRHGIDAKLRVGILQLPRHVMDVSPAHDALIDGIQAIALGEEIFERSLFSHARAPKSAGNARGTPPASAFAGACWCIRTIRPEDRISMAA